MVLRPSVFTEQGAGGMLRAMSNQSTLVTNLGENLFCANQNAPFPSRFWRRAHDNFHILPESREAFDQFAFGNPPKLTT